MRSYHTCWALFNPPIKHGKLGRLMRYTKTSSNNKGWSGCGVRLSERCSRIFLLKGGLVAVSRAHPKKKLAVAKERSAKVGPLKKACAYYSALICYLYHGLASKQRPENMVPVHRKDAPGHMLNATHFLSKNPQ